MFMKQAWLVTVLFVHLCNAWHWPSFGKCPELNVKQNFSIESYLGTWYQQSSAFTEFEGKGRCVSASYSKNSTTDAIDLVNQIIREPSNNVFKMNGTAILEDKSKNEGKLVVTLFSKILWWEIHFSGPYWILDTDYESYAVVYSCNEFLWFHDYSSILFSRVQVLSPDDELKFNNITSQVLKDHNLNPTDFQPSSNVNCSQHN